MPATRARPTTTKNAICFAENTPHFEEGAPCFDRALRYLQIHAPILTQPGFSIHRSIFDRHRAMGIVTHSGRENLHSRLQQSCFQSRSGEIEESPEL